ncbi:unnamed protein product [Caenorhabditis nigoni]
MESAVSSVFRSLGSAFRLQLPTASPSPMSNSTSRVIVSDANPLDDVPMEDATGPVVPAVVAPAKVVYHTSNSAIFNSEGLVDEIPFVGTLAVRCGAYFIFSNQSRLIIWSMNTRSTVIDENLNCHSLCSLSNDTLQVLDGDFNLVSNFLNDH